MMEEKRRNSKGSIAVDLDNTLADTSSVVVKEIRDRYNPDASIECWTQYSADKSFGIPHSITLKLFHEAWRSWRDIPIVDRAIPGVLSKARTRADIYIVTATVGRKEDFTQWLDYHRVGYDGIIVVDHSTEKINVGKLRGIGTYIDDHDVVARSVAAEGRRVILLEQPWNHDFAESNSDPNIIPARDWAEIGSILESLYAEPGNQ